MMVQGIMRSPFLLLLAKSVVIIQESWAPTVGNQLGVGLAFGSFVGPTLKSFVGKRVLMFEIISCHTMGCVT